MSLDLQSKIYKEIAKEFNMDLEVIEDMCRTEWLFLNELIKSKTFESIRMKYLGVFGVKRFRPEYVEKMYLSRAVREEKGNDFEFLFEKFKEKEKKIEIDRRQTPVTQYKLNGTIKKQYPTIKEAAIDTNISFVCISQCCKKNKRDNGKNYTAKGHIWKYTNIDGNQKEKENNNNSTNQ